MSTLPPTDTARTISPGLTPDLAEYDLTVINSSAGKDSQAVLDLVVEAATAAGTRDRLVVAHADLAEAEWPGARALAAEHAAHYGLRFEVAARHRPGQPHVQTILERVAERGMWPDAARRWCTSDHKRGPIRRLLTRLTTELRESGAVTGRPARILEVLGIRAQESAARARHLPYRHNPAASNGRRHVDTWLPVHAWTTDQVWDRIAAAGTRPHWAYRHGMTRLSCRFCVLASRADLICAARLNPALAAAYAAVEARIGHRFRRDLSMADIITAAESTPGPTWRQLTLTDSERA